MTLTISPPELQPSTASSALIVAPDDLEPYEITIEDLVAEPMDYTPIARGRLAGPEFPDEVEPDDDEYGPAGY